MHFRNICQHSHDDSIRSTISHYKRYTINCFTSLLNQADEKGTSVGERLKQLVVGLIKC